MAKYYLDGHIKSDGAIYEFDGGEWVLDFYHDWSDVIKPEYEVSEEFALKRALEKGYTKEQFYGKTN